MEQTNRRLRLAVVICVLSVIVMGIVLVMTGKKEQTAEFSPPPFEEYAVAGVPEVADNLGWSEVDAKVYKASVCGEVIVKSDMADIWLTNPQENTVWLKLRILDHKGTILGETGIIKPGEYVQSIKFDTIPEDGDTVGLKLMAYQPDTYYSEGSATLNTIVKVEK